jgi:hypothetical protein
MFRLAFDVKTGQFESKPFGHVFLRQEAEAACLGIAGVVPLVRKANKRLQRSRSRTRVSRFG